jgi:CO dehydrogenase/acetyl-CoA synthase beta subunit
MFKVLKYPANDGNFCRVDMIDVIMKEEFKKILIDDLVDRLITNPANNEFEKFLEQLELKILKYERREQDHGSQSQNCELYIIF